MKQAVFLVVDYGIDGGGKESIRYASINEEDRDAWYEASENKAYQSKVDRVCDLDEVGKALWNRINGLERLAMQKGMVPLSAYPSTEDNPQLSKEEFEFAAYVVIAAAIDHIRSAWDARWFKHGGLSKFLKGRQQLPEPVRDHFFNFVINQLGWSLSILYAQTCNDGIGVAEALDIDGIGGYLRTWAEHRYAGSVGIHPSQDDPDVGEEDLPSAKKLAKTWCESLWKSMGI